MEQNIMHTDVKEVDQMIEVETWLPLFPGFYGTVFDGDDDVENEIYSINQERASSNLNDDVDYDDLKIDWKGYQDEVVTHCCYEVQDYMREIGIDLTIELQSIHSPREYNFRNDSGNIKVTISEEMIEKFIALLYKHRGIVNSYLKSNFTSYDGFCSFYSNNFEEWEEETDSFRSIFHDDTFRFGALMEALIEGVGGFDYHDMYNNMEVYVSSYVENYDDLVTMQRCEKCGEWCETENLRDVYNESLEKVADYYKSMGQKMPKPYTFEQWVAKAGLKTLCFYCTD